MRGASLTPAAWVLLATTAWLSPSPDAPGQEPPALNPFKARAETPRPREDAQPGYLVLSDGRVRPGWLSLTRDARLKIFDEGRQRQREIPWNVVRRIDCTVVKEWDEPEWRFLENASDQKVLTGRTYPAREYAHQLALRDGQTIRGPLAGIVYLQADPAGDPVRFLLHKRDKGEPGTTLKALVYVRSIHLGEKALEEGKRMAAQGAARSAGAGRSPARKGRPK